jgi:recombination protein RecR
MRKWYWPLAPPWKGIPRVFYLDRKLQGIVPRVSMIARGISIGGDLEQVDEMTLGRSIADRKPYEQSVFGSDMLMCTCAMST